MKIKDITLSNLSKFETVTCSFDPNITYLVGKNGAGKSTIGITGVQAILQGIAEKSSGGNCPVIGERFRFIGPRSASSKNELTLIDEKRSNAEIKVIRKFTKSGSELSFVAPEDYPDTLDQAWLNSLFNQFLIAPKRFTELTPQQQAIALGIDTKELDATIATLKQEYTVINRELKSFASLEPVEDVKKVDVNELDQKREAIRARLNQEYKENKATNAATRESWEAGKKKVDEEVAKHNAIQLESKQLLNAAGLALKSLLDLGYNDEAMGGSVKKWIDTLPSVEPDKKAIDLYESEPTDLSKMPEDYTPAPGESVYIKELPDDTDLRAVDHEMLLATETNQKALLFDQYKEKLAQKEAKEKELADNKQKQEDADKERSDYIQRFKFPFKNLSVNEEGALMLDGKLLKEPYFSTGELLKFIPIMISSQNPELKYVFLQDFNLLDEDKQSEIENYLVGKGFQLVVEYVSKSAIPEKNCILLSDGVIIDGTEAEDNTPSLL